MHNYNNFKLMNNADFILMEFSLIVKHPVWLFMTNNTVQKTGYTLSDILRIFRVYASRIPLAE